MKDWSICDIFVVWIFCVLVIEEGLLVVEFDVYFFFLIFGVFIDWRFLMKALRIDVFDMVESLWFFCLENGILFLVGIIFVIVVVGWFRVLVIRVSVMRKTVK